MKAEIDLNCDAGEGVGNEAELLRWVSSVNIACGGHAGNEATMAEAMEVAREAGVTVGAHPGFVDREGFGRRELELGDSELFDLIVGQLEALRRHGEFGYVKPHGGLYHLAAREQRVAEAIVLGVKAFDPELGLVGLAGGHLIQAGEASGIAVVGEGFSDRRYSRDGRLVSREVEGAVIEDEVEAVEQGVSLVINGSVRATDGEAVPVEIDTVCVHGDSVGAVGFARRLRGALEDAGIVVRPAFGGRG